MSQLNRNVDRDIFLLPIAQAKAATFVDLYFQSTVLILVHTGSKRVLCPINGELVGEVGDAIVFPMGSVVTLENRPVLRENYRATGVCFSLRAIEAVFANDKPTPRSAGIQLASDCQAESAQILNAVRDTLSDPNIPEPIRQYRLLEPLVWLKSRGIYLSPHAEDKPLSKVRRLIQTDLTHPWRSSEVAKHFAVSEATMRRWLAESGQGFSKILQNTRLEQGLSLLQSTDTPVADIAFTCGFKTSSHFSDSFKKRFGLNPSEIRKVEDRSED
ncbi:MAG: helix-turn-helix transcriptional regulator [Geitlerinemataceae cyanobacterium]